MSSNNKRRSFIKGIGIGTAALGTLSFGLNAKDDKEKKEKHFAMIFDQNKCVGCTECEVACKKEHDVPGLHNDIFVPLEHRSSSQQVRLYVEDQTDPENRMNKKYMRVSCQQCVDAPCSAVCPTGACPRDEETGIVTMTMEKCIGCKYCIVACPYDVRFINKTTRAAEACNFCLDTRKISEGELPACVTACKYDALIFGDLNNEDDYINKVLAVKDSVRLKPQYGTKPSLRYIPKLRKGVSDE